ALKKETHNATVLIVAQRINTVMHAEQIIVLDNGRIAGKGTHKELMENCTVYRELALSQLSTEELSA
ncbi:MAG: ABC transporter ATP-binding protein, partial [Spongiibacteraceae bacterium]